MSSYQVNPVTVKAAMEEMSAAGSKLLTQIEALKSFRSEMNTRWEGPANIAYDEVLSGNIQILELYYKTLQDYIEVLYEDTMEYAATEEENVQRLQAAVE